MKRLDEDEEAYAQCRMCRICFEDGEPETLVAPCNCKGAAPGGSRR
jgi:E3 ubiquitin-protein ligase DOA10